MYLKNQKGDMSFQISDKEIIAYKNYNNKIYKIKKVLTTNSISYLINIIKSLEVLEMDFWEIMQNQNELKE